MKGKTYLEEYEIVRQELENLNELKTKGTLIRSKAKWIEEGEKSTKYFLQLENRNYKSKYIKCLQWKNNIIKEPSDILGAHKTFYETLYAEPDKSLNCKGECPLFSTIKAALSAEDQLNVINQLLFWNVKTV